MLQLFSFSYAYKLLTIFAKILTDGILASATGGTLPHTGGSIPSLVFIWEHRTTTVTSDTVSVKLVVRFPEMKFIIKLLLCQVMQLNTLEFYCYNVFL